ncbi:MAG: TRAP transporter small permease [Oscillospiraceae bacterium]
MNPIETLKKVGHRVYQVYFGIVVAAMGLMASCVIFSVIARYFFSMSWKALSEFNVTLFAFTTFMGIGICILDNEHVIIDVFYDRVKPSLKRWLSVANYTIVLIVLLFFTFYAFQYTAMAGKQLSPGMEIPMYFMYGIMPIGGIISCLCTVVRIIKFIVAPLSEFAPVNVVLPKLGDADATAPQTPIDPPNNTTKEA